MRLVETQVKVVEVLRQGAHERSNRKVVARTRCTQFAKPSDVEHEAQSVTHKS